jgi:Tc5 transposase DNA-binding domain
MPYSVCCYADAAAKARAKFPRAEVKVYKLYRERRARGLPVSGHWLRARLRSTVKSTYPNNPAAQKFKASRKYLMLFCRRHQLARRKKTNCKHLRFV